MYRKSKVFSSSRNNLKNLFFSNTGGIRKIYSAKKNYGIKRGWEKILSPVSSEALARR